MTQLKNNPCDTFTADVSTFFSDLQTFHDFLGNPFKVIDLFIRDIRAYCSAQVSGHREVDVIS